MASRTTTPGDTGHPGTDKSPSSDSTTRPRYRTRRDDRESLLGGPLVGQIGFEQHDMLKEASIHPRARTVNETEVGDVGEQAVTEPSLKPA